MAIPTRIHGLVDYALALVLLAFPWTLDLPARAAETWVPVAAGVVLLGYSLATDYERGILRRIQIPVHLWCDGLLGLLLAVSPWLFGFDTILWMPYVAVGTLLIGIAFLSHTVPGYERRGAHG